MIISVLIENTTSSSALGCEHGLSLYIETGKHNILFDTGTTGLFAENAAKMGIDLSKVDIAVLSHGHYDHSGGLKTFLSLNQTAKVYLHSEAFGEYYGYEDDGRIEYIGLDKSLLSNERFVFTGDSFIIDDGLKLFSGVKGKRFYPAGNADLLIKTGDTYIKDDFKHEQNLIITEDGKRVLITGCAHNGIVNIIDHFKNEEGGLPDYVVGGFHLSNPETNVTEDPKIVKEIAGFFMETGSAYYTGHCTGIGSYNILKETLEDRIGYISTGSVIKI
jgi:Metal-dependent hydrolases of the beta-lactamase superfamily II